MKSVLNFAAKSAQILVASLILVWLVYLLQYITIETTKLYAPRKTQTRQPYTPDPARRSYRFLLDGTVHQIRAFQEPDAQGKLLDMEEVYDANNTFIERRLTQDPPDSRYLSFASGLHYMSDKEDLNRRHLITSGFSRTMDVPVVRTGTVQEIWRYNRQREIFTGHDRAGNGLGCLGRKGFEPGVTSGAGLGAVQRYHWWQSEDGHVKLLWLTQEDLYEIDVNQREVEHLVECREDYAGSVAGQAWYDTDKTARGYVDPNIYRPLIVSQLDEHTYRLVLRDPAQNITVSVPEAWDEWGGYCRFAATKTGLFMVRYWNDYPRQPDSYYESPKEYQQWVKEYYSVKKRQWTELYGVDAQGHLEKLKALSWKQTRLRDTPIFSAQSWTARRWVQCLSPGLCIAGYKQLHAQYSSSMDYRERFLYFILRMMPQGPWDCLIPTILFAGAALWHGRPRWTSKAQATFWVVFVLCLNLAGLLVYLALNHTPVVQCTSCHNKRGLSKDACTRCRSPLPVPEHTRPHLLSLG